MPHPIVRALSIVLLTGAGVLRCIAAPLPAGATVFANHCAVCHGPEAAGIPGSFPSLHEQIVAFAKTPAGREYLVMVLTTGLMGELQVGGNTYHGVMPAQSTLSELEVAAVLNYLGSGLGKLKPPPAPIAASEVGEIRARHPDKSPQNTRALRPSPSGQ
ncbi:MAG: cytochrome c [Steroidobacteraceae bacterium]|jgi:mono/diheme cytochrome c family protein